MNISDDGVGSRKEELLEARSTKNVEMFGTKGGVQKKKRQIIHILWIRGGSRHVDKKKFLNVNIINFENVDKPEGGGVGQCG